MTSPAPYLLRTGTVPAPKPAEKPLLSRVFRRFSQEILLAFGFVLLTLWLATLISHHPADSAWSTTGSHLSPSNWLGIMGAWISDISLFSVGRSIWVLFFALVAAWLRLLRHWVGVRQLAAMQQTDHRADTPVSTTGQPPRWAQRLWHNRLLWGCALFMLMLACCVLEWSRLYTINPASLPNGPGGVIGALAGPVAIRWLGFTGSAVTAIVLILACLSWVFRFSWLRVAELLGAQVDSWLMAARERRELAHDLAVGQEAARQREPSPGRVGAWAGRVGHRPTLQRRLASPPARRAGLSRRRGRAGPARTGRGRPRGWPTPRRWWRRWRRGRRRGRPGATRTGQRAAPR